MAKGFGEKLKILLIRDYLLKYTDEEHSVSVKDIMKHLEEHEIIAERKSIYRDLKTLGCAGADDEPEEADAPSYGMDIVRRRGEYHVRERDFTLQELKLLVDMVQSSNSITQRKTKELINKLEGLTSVYEAKTLNRTVYVRNRVKAMNESVYINVDKISEAINEDKILQFQYFSYNIRKQKELRHDGAFYKISPFALIWVDQNYYMLGFSDRYQEIRAYRVDRMTRVMTADGPRHGKKDFENIDIATFTTKVFHMYMGELQRVVMRCDKSLVNTIIDRFGTDILIIPSGSEQFTIEIEVAVSPQFYGWVAGFGKYAEIVAPPNVRQGMAEHLRESISVYDK